ncbi:MAG: hypothetical protein KDE22_18115 [Rhodobacterales bacterium]|nr:hypothetical protein [Rhodobacterales bacterium]
MFTKSAFLMGSLVFVAALMVGVTAFDVDDRITIGVSCADDTCGTSLDRLRDYFDVRGAALFRVTDLPMPAYQLDVSECKEKSCRYVIADRLASKVFQAPLAYPTDRALGAFTQVVLFAFDRQLDHASASRIRTLVILTFDVVSETFLGVPPDDFVGNCKVYQRVDPNLFSIRRDTGARNTLASVVDQLAVVLETYGDVQNELERRLCLARHIDRMLQESFCFSYDSSKVTCSRTP